MKTSINIKAYKVLAERAAVSILLNNRPDFDEEDGLSENDLKAINREYDKIAEQIRVRAVKVGGEFNRFSPFN